MKSEVIRNLKLAKEEVIDVIDQIESGKDWKYTHKNIIHSIKLMTSSPLARAGYPVREDDISAFNSSTGLWPVVFLNSAIKSAMRKYIFLNMLQKRKTDEFLKLYRHVN